MEERVTILEREVSEMKTRMAVAEANIKDVKEDISSIKDDTRWMRRTITNAIIVSLVGGVIGLAFAFIRMSSGGGV